MVTEEVYGSIKNNTDSHPAQEEITNILYKLGIIDEQGNVTPQYVGMLKNVNIKNTDNIEK